MHPAHPHEVHAAAYWAHLFKVLSEPADHQDSAHPDGFRTTIWDRLGLWFVVAVLLVVLAYAVPVWDLVHMTRYGSQGFKPF